jgi:hypothetical protein
MAAGKRSPSLIAESDVKCIIIDMLLHWKNKPRVILPDVNRVKSMHL